MTDRVRRALPYVGLVVLAAYLGATVVWGDKLFTLQPVQVVLVALAVIFAVAPAACLTAVVVHAILDRLQTTQAEREEAHRLARQNEAHRVQRREARERELIAFMANAEPTFSDYPVAQLEREGLLP